MKYTYLGDPCRNFCILASIQILDPKDGCEKVVLSSHVSGRTGGLVFIDPKNGEGEWIEFPGDEGAWALMNLDNESILVGSCGLKGMLHRLDLKTRTWYETLRYENETYIWNFAMGSDGMVYGGTYNSCLLLKYDPIRHTLESVGRVSDKKENQYSRQVYGGADDRIFISCGVAKPHVTSYNIKTGEFINFGKPGATIKEVNKDYVCTITAKELDFYNPCTLEPLDISLYASKLEQNVRDSRLPSVSAHIRTLADGSLFGIRGQEYFVLKENDKVAELKRIPVEAPPTQILGITTAPDGKIWGASNFGQTIFNYDTKDGSYWNSNIVTNGGGQVYSLQYINNKVYMSAYGGGDHIVYDPSKPWDQVNNVNPETLRSVAPALIRPHAGSVIGPDGAYWTGWTAKYGIYGGGISRVDTTTHEVTSWYDPIPEQAIESLTCDDKYLYFTTNGTGNGLKRKVEPFWMCKWTTEGEFAWKKQFPEGIHLGSVKTAGKYVLVVVDTSIEIYENEEMQLLYTVETGANSPGNIFMIRYDEDTVAVSAGNRLLFITPATGVKEEVLELPGLIRAASVNEQGVLYFTFNSHLYRLDK